MLLCRADACLTISSGKVGYKKRFFLSFVFIDMVSDTIKKQEVMAENPLMMKPATIEQDESLEAAVLRNLQSYFKTLNGMRPQHELYPMVIQAVEKPLLEFVMKRTGHNKCAAAQLLGINRNTLHKKLQFYKLI